jgi:hypothetical protein
MRLVDVLPQPAPDGTLEWVEDGAEVLVFDHNGVRRAGEGHPAEIAEPMLVS